MSIIDEINGWDNTEKGENKMKNAVCHGLFISAALLYMTMNGCPRKADAHVVPEDIAEEHCETQHLNHFYDENGRLVFNQIIYENQGWYDPEIQDWRLYQKAGQYPRKNYHTGNYESLWHDGDILRKIISQTRKESWTQTDPEIEAREFLPKENRKQLLKFLPPEE